MTLFFPITNSMSMVHEIFSLYITLLKELLVLSQERVVIRERVKIAVRKSSLIVKSFYFYSFFLGNEVSNLLNSVIFPYT